MALVLRAIMTFLLLMVLLSVAWVYYSEKKKGSPTSEMPSEGKSFDEWHLYTSPTGQFQVFLPTLPQSASSKMQDPKTQETKVFSTHVSQKPDGTIYMVSLIAFPTDNADESDASLVNQAIQDMVVARDNNTLKEMKNGVYKGHKTIDFVIENGDLNIWGKAFKKDKKIVILTVTKPKGAIDPEEFNFFINSFEMKP